MTVFSLRIVTLLCLLVPQLALAADLELRLLDVGQADAVLLRHAGKAVLIDAGGRDDIVVKLSRLGVRKLDLLVITHNHQDHLGGADAVLTQLAVDRWQHRYVGNGRPAQKMSHRDVIALLASRGVQRVTAAMETIQLGDASLQLLPPPQGMSSDDENDHSVGAIVRRGAFEALLTGDSGADELNGWLDQGLIPDVDVLKAAHHGSRTGVTPGGCT